MYLVKCNGKQVIFNENNSISFSNEDYTIFSSKEEAKDRIGKHMIHMDIVLGSLFERYVRENDFEIVEVM